LNTTLDNVSFWTHH